MNFATISVSAATANTLISGVAGTTIRVKGVFWIALHATLQSVTFQGSSSGTFTGAMLSVAGVPHEMSPSSMSWFETVAGEDLDITLAHASQVSGVILYEQD